MNDKNSGIQVIFSIGHSTRTLQEFISLLKENGVTLVADIRTIPRSRHNPQFNEDSLPVTLKEAGIGYTHMKGLGGLRHPLKDSVNTAWRNDSFRGFADYMQTPEFIENLSFLIELAKRDTICLLCAEAVPWRCHRSLIADALFVRGITVRHVPGKGPLKPHVLTPWAKVDGINITYPGGE